MLPGVYRDIFIAIATSAASLTGLLFVVMSVEESQRVKSQPAVVQEVRAAAALLSFTNPLAVSLFSLVPGTNVGYPALVVAIIGLLFSAAGTRSFLARDSGQHRHWRHLVLTTFLFLAFALELIEGIELLRNPHRTGPVSAITYILVASLFIGIARAWELIGGRDTGIIASLTMLTGREPGSQEPADRTLHGPLETGETRASPSGPPARDHKS